MPTIDNSYQDVQRAFQEGQRFPTLPGSVYGDNPRVHNEADGFYQFDFLENKEKLAPEAGGWKTHWSVAPDDMPRATEILLDVYRKYKAGTFKAVDPQTANEFSNPRDSQAGKMFTAYDYGEKSWPKIMMEVERRFREAGIKPGPAVHGEMPVKGSFYGYRRNDSVPHIKAMLERPDLSPEARAKLKDANYIDAETAKAVARQNGTHPANPYNQPDPLANVDLRNSVRSARADQGVIAGQKWAEANSATFGKVTRTDVTHMDDDQRRALQTSLKNQTVDSKLVQTGDGRYHVQIEHGHEAKVQTIAQGFKPATQAPRVTGTMVAGASAALGVVGFITGRETRNRDAQGNLAQQIGGATAVGGQVASVTTGIAETVTGVMQQGTKLLPEAAATSTSAIVGKVASRLALPVAAVATVGEVVAGIASGDAERATGAVGGLAGGVAGGIAAGAALGAMGGAVTGPFALVTAAAGAVIGGLVGETAVRSATSAIKDALGGK